MNKLLEHVFSQAAKLSDEQQEAIAARILQDMATERGWDERFAKSQDLLADLARQAGEHIAQGTTLPHDSADRRDG
jgi:glutathionylspermidine synthase